MEEQRERFLKLTQEKKSNKRLVKLQQATCMGSAPESAREGSSGSSSSRDVECEARY